MQLTNILDRPVLYMYCAMSGEITLAERETAWRTRVNMAPCLHYSTGWLRLMSWAKFGLYSTKTFWSNESKQLHESDIKCSVDYHTMHARVMGHLHVTQGAHST